MNQVIWGHRLQLWEIVDFFIPKKKKKTDALTVSFKTYNSPWVTNGEKKENTYPCCLSLNVSLSFTHTCTNRLLVNMLNVNCDDTITANGRLLHPHHPHFYVCMTGSRVASSAFFALSGHACCSRSWPLIKSLASEMTLLPWRCSCSCIVRKGQMLDKISPLRLIAVSFKTYNSPWALTEFAGRAMQRRKKKPANTKITANQNKKNNLRYNLMLKRF